MANIAHQYTTNKQGQMECMEWLENLQIQHAIQHDKRYWTKTVQQYKDSKSQDGLQSIHEGTIASSESSIVIFNDYSDDDDDDDDEEEDTDKIEEEYYDDRMQNRRLDLLFDNNIDPFIHRHMSLDVSQDEVFGIHGTSTTDNISTSIDIHDNKFYPNRYGMMTKFDSNLDLLRDVIRIDVDDHVRQHPIATSAPSVAKRDRHQAFDSNNSEFYTSNEKSHEYPRGTDSTLSSQYFIDDNDYDDTRTTTTTTTGTTKSLSTTSTSVDSTTTTTCRPATQHPAIISATALYRSKQSSSSSSDDSNWKLLSAAPVIHKKSSWSEDDYVFVTTRNKLCDRRQQQQQQQKFGYPSINNNFISPQMTTPMIHVSTLRVASGMCKTSSPLHKKFTVSSRGSKHCHDKNNQKNRITLAARPVSSTAAPGVTSVPNSDADVHSNDTNEKKKMKSNTNGILRRPAAVWKKKSTPFKLLKSSSSTSASSTTQISASSAPLSSQLRPSEKHQHYEGNEF
jgi:hypothetical protein